MPLTPLAGPAKSDHAGGPPRQPPRPSASPAPRAAFGGGGAAGKRLFQEFEPVGTAQRTGLDVSAHRGGFLTTVHAIQSEALICLGGKGAVASLGAGRGAAPTGCWTGPRGPSSSTAARSPSWRSRRSSTSTSRSTWAGPLCCGWLSAVCGLCSSVIGGPSHGD